MQNMIDENLDRIDKAGSVVGNLVGKVIRFLGKNTLAWVALLILGVGVFIYSIISGAMKKDKS